MRTGDAWAFGNDRLAVGRAWKRRDWMTRNGEVAKGMGCERQPQSGLRAGSGWGAVQSAQHQRTSTARLALGPRRGGMKPPAGLPPPRPGRGPTRRLGAQR